MTSSHNRYSAQYAKQDFFRSDEFRCMSCGDYYPECTCSGSFKENALRKTWQQFMVEKLEGHDDSTLIFSTLTFGCTRCGGTEEDERHSEASGHDYLVPGPQAGRKRFKKYWDALYTIGLKVEAVYGAEERGSFGGRLHYHSVSRVSGVVTDDMLDNIKSHWLHGFSMINIIDKDEGFRKAVAYVTKYVSKSQNSVGNPLPFFYYTYRPQFDGYWSRRLEGHSIHDKIRYSITTSGRQALEETQ